MAAAFEYRIAYIYTNGDVEGFVGTALGSDGKDRAREDALRKLRNKISHIQVHRPEEKFEEARLIETEEQAKQQLKPDALESVKDHWEISRRSNEI